MITQELSGERTVMSFNSAAKDLNDLTFTDYFYRLMLLARSVFKWENLPNSIDEKWIEKYLFFYGRCMFFKDPEKGLMVAKCTDSGILNYYDEPTKLTPVATNYKFIAERLDNYEECILIRNNDDMIATRHTIQLYALRLTEIMRTIDINIQAQQTPTLVTCTDKDKFSLMQVFKKWKGHEPVIYGDKSFDSNSVRVFKTDAPIVFDKLQLQKHALWNECMTFLGINNANQDKRERLVTDEVSANNEQIEMSAQIMLKARETAAEQINKLFKTNITVRMRNAQEIRDELGTDTDEPQNTPKDSKGDNIDD